MQAREVPEIFADNVVIATGEAAVFLGFQLIPSPISNVLPGSDPQEGTYQQTELQAIRPELKAVVRLNPTQAKIFAIMLKQALMDLEEKMGVISLPPGFAERTGSAGGVW